MASSASSSSSSLDGASTPTIASLPLAALRPHARLCAGADGSVSPANAAPVKVRLLEAPDETLGETLQGRAPSSSAADAAAPSDEPPPLADATVDTALVTHAALPDLSAIAPPSILALLGSAQGTSMYASRKRSGPPMKVCAECGERAPTATKRCKSCGASWGKATKRESEVGQPI